MAGASETRSFCTLCKSRCGVVYTVERGRITGARPDPDHPNGGALCPKGRAAPELAHATRRLTRPLRRTRPKGDPDPGWVPISWDEALDETAARLGAIAAESGPEAVAFATGTPSGTSLSDATEWIERLAWTFGTPNTVFSTEICNWHKDTAHRFTFGTALPVPDYEHTDLVLLWGFDPAKTWLAQSAALGAARARGARLAVVDPRRSVSARDADHWLRIRPGTDAALALGLAHQLIEHRRHDEDFVRRWTNAPLLVDTATGRFLRRGEDFLVQDTATGTPRPYDTRRPAVRPADFALTGRYRVDGTDCEPAFAGYARACAAWTPERVEAETWVPAEQVRALGRALGEAGSVSYYGWTGVAQQSGATQTERALATLYALTGSFDTPGGNVPLPRPPAAPGSDYRRMLPEPQRAKALGFAERPLGPPADGWITARDLCRAVTEAEPYRVRALVGFGANLLVSQPDSARTARMLDSLDFQVHLDLFENPTASRADLLLPVAGPWEREALRIGFETSHRAQEQVQLRPRIVAPPGEARSDLDIVFDLAVRMGLGAEFFDGDLEAAWRHQLAPLGLTPAELRERPGGIRVPLPRRHRSYAEPTGPDGTVQGFATPTRRVELHSETLAAHGHPAVPAHRPPTAPTPAFPLVLTCAKNGYFVHSQHRGVSSLRRRRPDPLLELAPATAAARGIADGQWTELRTPGGSIRLKARLEDSLHPGVVVSDYGWWQPAPDLGLPGADPLAAHGSNLNLLARDEEADPLSGSVPLRAMICEVVPLPTAPEEPALWTGTRAFTVTEATDAGPGVRALTLTPEDGGPLPDHRPGQHVTLRVAVPGPDGPVLARSYSLTGAAREPGRTAYRLAVREVPGGAVSGHLHHGLRPGDRIGLDAPAGGFVIPTDTDAPVVLIAGGIGITPFLCYLETLEAGGGTVPEVVLHHGARNSADHPFRERLGELAAALPRLRVVRHYADPLPEDRPGRDYEHRGFPSAAAVDPELIARRARFHLCGPEAMTESVTTGLRERGVPPFEVFSELFAPPRPTADVPPDARFRVRFTRSGRELDWTAADGPLLGAAERAGIGLPSGCRVGQCESCVVPVARGRVQHLVPAPDLPEDSCLTCQSVPASDLDLDA
ncbi:molybdopterin-dependent oxidoreductase [Streptomyces sp. NPDC097619]|uniref:molybdopterin-dependent oxidoreductase n=1 Tax=Streptomyces sp. NPDC097619 TaxID=3157228 RepID=UPI00332DFC02